MVATPQPDGSLRIYHFESFLLVLVIALVVIAIGIWFTPATPKQSAIWDAVLLVFSLAALAGVERSEFVFDRKTQSLSWRKKTPFRQESGTIPFGAIKSIVLQRDFTSSGRPGNARRLVILTTGGPVPVTNAYSGFTRAAERVGAEISDYLSAGAQHPIAFER